MQRQFTLFLAGVAGVASARQLQAVCIDKDTVDGPAIVPVTYTQVCFQAESIMHSDELEYQESVDADGNPAKMFKQWVYEEDEGLIRYMGPDNDVEAAVKHSDVLCYEVELPSEGVYRVITSTNRKKYGRKPTLCDSSDRETSLSACKKEYGVECVCEDLENDFWLIMQAPALSVELDACTPAKAMGNCPWDVTCKRRQLNIDHQFYSAVYELPQGKNIVCIAGRSKMMALDEICLRNMRPKSVL